MAAKTAIGPISDRKVGSNNIVKVTKVVAERPRFTIISTKRKDCVSQTMQVRLAATTMVHQRLTEHISAAAGPFSHYMFFDFRCHNRICHKKQSLTQCSCIFGWIESVRNGVGIVVSGIRPGSHRSRLRAVHFHKMGVSQLQFHAECLFYFPCRNVNPHVSGTPYPTRTFGGLRWSVDTPR